MSDAARSGSVLAKAIRGTGWVIGWRMATRLLGLVSTLVLARLLLPADFGTVALGTSFVQAIDAFSVLGVEDALIRERSLTRALYDTGFTINALRGLATGLIAVALAWPVARFFHDPHLAVIVLALAGAMMVSGLENIGIIDYRRNFMFSKEFKLYILPRVVGIGVTIAYAACWHSYWALVAGIVSTRGLRCLFSYLLHPYRPRITLQAWRSISHFSFWTWVISVLQIVRDRFPSMVVGRVLGSSAVGILAIGGEISWLPVTELIAPLTRPAYPAFAAARHGQANAAHLYIRLVAAVLLIAIPAGAGLSVLARPIVTLALGEQWSGAIPVIQLCGLMAGITVFPLIGGTVLSAYARLATLTRIIVVSLILQFALQLPFILEWGIMGAAISSTVVLVGEAALHIAAVSRVIGLRAGAIATNVWRPCLATCVMVASLLSLGAEKTVHAGTVSTVVHLLGFTALGALIYAGALLALWFASGRPRGSERDLLDFAHHSWASLHAPNPAPVGASADM